MKHTSVLKLSILLITVFSCTERIEIDPGESYTRLVVEGIISTDRTAQTVILSTTAGYFSNQPVPAVSGALVTLSDGQITYTLKEMSPGRYQTGTAVSGIPGRQYSLYIKLTAPVGGFTEYSATSTMSQKVVLDSIQMKFYPSWSEKGIWEIKGFFLDPPEADFYRFLVSRNGVMITDTLSEWYVTDDQFFNGKYLLGTTIGWLQQHLPDETLKAGDKLTAELDVIDKEFSEFIRSARFNLAGSNPLFSGPPANPKGNISNGAIGYFAAYAITRASCVVTEVK
jgi:hypothetical protein